MRDTQRDRDTGRKRSRFPAGTLMAGLDSGTPGSHPEPKAGAQPLNDPGIPREGLFIEIMVKWDQKCNFTR